MIFNTKSKIILYCPKEINTFLSLTEVQNTSTLKFSYMFLDHFAGFFQTLSFKN
uniref:Uncharacterized protein n=1 Tax=Theropithecus gelada TaxID=9565 RepID=A0A8D2FL81_THEGE